MDIDSPFTMVVLIVLIAVGAGIINNWLKLRESRASDAASAGEMARMKADLDRLSERVRVLERLATDNDRRLHDEISRLA